MLLDASDPTRPPPPPEPHPWRMVHAVAVLLVLAAFLASVRSILNPFLLFILLVFFLQPYRGTRHYLLTVSASGLLTFVWLLDTTGFLLAPFVLSIVLAYVLHPLVNRLTGRRVTRSMAVMILALPMVGALVLLVFVGVPALSAQVAEFIRDVPGFIRGATAWLERMQVTLATRDVPGLDEQALIERLRAIQPESVMAYLQERQSAVAAWAWQAVLGVGKGLGAILTLLGYVFLTPILTFYLLRDWPDIEARLEALVPGPYRDRVLGLATEYDRLLAGYLRGQLLQSSIVGVLTWILFAVAGFPQALLLGVLAGVFNVIPYMGMIVAMIPAVAIALFSPDPGWMLGKAVLVTMAVQALDSTVLGPKIVGDSVGLHPVWVILALSISGYFFGFVGLLIAVPLAVLVSLLLRIALLRYRESALFRGESRLVPLE
jgi:predicted PurR-regulated permease PerM